MKLKFDACSLIESQKLEIIPLINQLHGKIYITGEVYNEAIGRGLHNHNPVADHLEEHIEQGWIRKIDSHGIVRANLGIGEAETIAEVIHENQTEENIAFVSEDKKALNEAIKNNLDVRSITILLLESCISGLITEDEFEEKIISFNKFHKLGLIRVSELRHFLKLFKSKEK
ncbi:MAG: hypothetical protein ACTSVL_08110 [Promethearchaeota archaeon]